MKLHIFNPEHDIALAHNDRYFTPPHAGRELRADLGFIPALWADDGDMVLVDNVEYAMECVRHLKGFAHDVVFIGKDDISALVNGATDPSHPFNIAPWGWDKALCFSLERLGVPASCMPGDASLDAVRVMSGRSWANVLRSRLPIYNKGVIAMPREHTSVEDFLACYEGFYHRHAVVKSPWSSSGRGVRYFRGELDAQKVGWVRNVIRQQGSIMSEVYYNKVKDFAVEFYAHEDGTVTYEGLSLFQTSNGAYTGNIVAAEEEKWRMIAKYGVAKELTEVIDAIAVCLQQYFRGKYSGPFGVDMMMLADGVLHPCVELNLRCTMGHVALALSSGVDDPRRLMRISYTDRYRLRIIDTFENVINNSLVSYM